MSENTLYYFFSSIAQVLAALTTLIVIILQFRLDGLKRYLIGDGHATYNRAIAKEKGHSLDTINLDRLRDSLGREDLDGIEAVLMVLHDTEKAEGETTDTRPRGLQFLYMRFKKMRSEITLLKEKITQIIQISLLTIILSIGVISTVDLIKCNIFLEVSVAVIIFILLLVSLWKTYCGIKIGLK